jgi:hypothetical protein
VQASRPRLRLRYSQTIDCHLLAIKPCNVTHPFVADATRIVKEDYVALPLWTADDLALDLLITDDAKTNTNGRCFWIAPGDPLVIEGRKEAEGDAKVVEVAAYGIA